ncbi:hypothetical protein ACDX78_18345 [Virgibacillus oceani]
MLNIIFTAYNPLPYGPLILAVSLVIILSVILSFIFRRKDKTDKGFVMLYYKLSYRRKLIRDIWTSPIILLILSLAFRLANIQPATEIIIYVIAIIGLGTQVIYHYIMWKKHEENR